MPNNTTKAVLNVKPSKNLKVYADEYFEKADVEFPGTSLSQEEIAWGAKCVDDMISGLYTAEELSKLKEAGIDPAMGILIDGKPADVYGTGRKFTSVVKEDNSAGKSKILANALNGKEIAITKFGFDENGNLKPQETVPVTTNLSPKIKEKKTGFFRRILEALGLRTSDLSKKIENVNNSPRNYDNLYQETTPSQEEIDKFKNDLADAKEKVAQNQLNDINVKVPGKSKTIPVAERQAITARLASESVKLAKFRNQMDLDFFGDQFKEDGKTSNSIISKHIQEKFLLSNIDSNGKTSSRQSIKSLSSGSRHTNLAIFYAMTQGYSFDEITAPENTALRKEMGKKFIEELGSMTFEEFAKKENLSPDINDPASKKAYREYYLNQSAKLEKFMCKSYDALRAENFEFPDPNDYNDIIQKYARFQLMGQFTQDLTQAVELKGHAAEVNIFDKNDPVSVEAGKRICSLNEYISAKVGTLTAMHKPIQSYYEFLSSPAFAMAENHSIYTPGIVNAAKGKAAMQFCHDAVHENNVDCLARIFDNDDLSSQLGAFKEHFMQSNNKQLADTAFDNFLCTNDPEMKTVVYDANTNKVVFFGKDIPAGEIMDTTSTVNAYYKDNAYGQANYNKYFTYDTTMTFTDAYEDGVRANPISEAEKAAKETYYADIHAKIDEGFKKQAAEEAIKKEQEEKLAAERNRPLTEAEKAAQEKENYITGAMKDGISRENAELLWKTEQHDKKVAQEIDGVMKEADKIQTETKTRMTRDELMGTTNQKMTMPPKETQAPTKQMGMSKP